MSLGWEARMTTNGVSVSASGRPGLEPLWAEGKTPARLWYEQNCFGAKWQCARRWGRGPGQGWDKWTQNTRGCPTAQTLRASSWEPPARRRGSFSKASWAQTLGSPRRWLSPPFGRGGRRDCDRVTLPWVWVGRGLTVLFHVGEAGSPQAVLRMDTFS